MPIDHKSDEAVKAYLLGTLPEANANEMEEKYFSDRTFFLRLQQREEALIREYLDGRLPRGERSRFENRYLRIPELQRKFEEVRRSHQLREELAGSLFGWRLGAFAGAIAVVLVMVWIYTGKLRQDPVEIAQQKPVETSAPQEYRLSPGIERSSSQSNRIVIVSGRPARLVLELPGVPAPVDCTVRILQINAEAPPTLIWSTSSPVASVPAPGGQQVEVTIDAGVLVRNDYIAEIAGPDGNTLEKYVFRAL